MNFDDDSDSKYWDCLKDFNNKDKVVIEENFDINNCINCNNNNFINDNGLIICSDCNTVQSISIENNAEWRYYGCDDNKGSDPTRVGLPTNNLLPVSSLGSFIGTNGKDSYEIKKIRKYDNWNKMPYRERSLNSTFDNFNIKASNNGINSAVVDEAKIMYKEITENKISRGKNKKGLEASCFLMAFKKLEVARSAKEIAEKFDLNIKVMTKGCKIYHNLTHCNIAPTKPEDFISRFCCKLKFNDDLINLAKIIANKGAEILTENTPQSIAAGCIYLVCNLCKLKVTKKEVHLSCSVSEVTINKCYKNLLP